MFREAGWESVLVVETRLYGVELGGEEVVVGTVRPDWAVRATGGSKTPIYANLHVDHAGSKAVKSPGNDI